MSQSLLIFLAMSPILLVFLFLVVLRWSARNAMILAFIAVLAIGLFVWKIPFNQIAASSVDGVVTAFTILYIVFGAVLLLNTLKESGSLRIIRETIAGITPDRRIQVVIILWVFGAFLEGAAGFGSTGAVIGPLLVALGFPAMAAAMSVMIFQSTTVSFGAVGTPLIIGVNSGLGEGTFEQVNATLSGMGWDQYIHSIGIKVALIHGIIGIFIPLFMVVLLCRFFGENKSLKEGFRAWKFCVFGGLCIVIPYVLTAIIFGPEFPSVFGGLIGIIPAAFAAKKGCFMPKDGVWDFADRKKWDKEWNGLIEVEKDEKKDEKKVSFSLVKAWAPYIIMAILLLASRLQFLPFGSWLKMFTIKFSNLFGTTISPSVQLLYLPGFIFIVVSILTYWMHQMDKGSYKKAVFDSMKVVIGAGSALIFAVPMIKVFLGSGGGAAGYESIPTVLAGAFTSISGGMWAFVAPLIGAMGAFIAGSNTFSNMMFSLFQFQVAENIGLNPAWVVALQAVGGAAGNIICVHNVVMACAAVGLIGKEGLVLRKVLVPAVYYILFAGSIGYVFLNGFGLNIGSIVSVAIVGTIITCIIINQSNPLQHQTEEKLSQL